MEEKKGKWWEDEREIAELIWCAAHLHHIMAIPSPEEEEQKSSSTPKEKGDDEKLEGGVAVKDNRPDEETEPRVPIATRSEPGSTYPQRGKGEVPSNYGASTVRVPDPFPLPKPAEIGKALLPLARRIPRRLADELDIEATVEITAEANGLTIPVLRPSLERWFEVHLLIDRGPSMEFWGDLGEAVATLFRWQGFFRDVRVWQLETRGDKPRLLSGSESIEREMASLIAPGGNRLFIVLTDTLGKAWRSGKAFAALSALGEQHSVTLAHIFPQTLWQRTVLEQAIQRPLSAHWPGCPNSKLKVGAKLRTRASLYQFPILNLDPEHFSTWANFIAGNEGNSIQGVLIRQERTEGGENGGGEGLPEAPEELLRGFQSNASPEARELAGVLAAVPLLPPIMRLAQRQFLPKSEHWHLAEVFFSGLIRRSPLSPAGLSVLDTWYEFHPGIRELLLEESPVQRSAEIWRKIGDYIESHYGSPRDFPALIPNPDGSMPDVIAGRDLYFAEVQAAILMTWGGEYADLARKLRATVEKRKGKLIDFTRLENLLESKKWKEADLETAKIMLKAANQERRGWLNAADLQELPSDVLMILERLWVESSQGNFGFSIQKEIWLRVGGQAGQEEDEEIYREFGERVGWYQREEGRWKIWDEYTFNLDAPRGHLPRYLPSQARRIRPYLFSRPDLFTREPLGATLQENLQEFDLRSQSDEVGKIAEYAPGKDLREEELETVYVNVRGEIERREKIQVYYYDEAIEIEGDKPPEPIRMVYIPPGEFWMGSPESEKDRDGDEGPQHLVKVPAFFMGQTQITQAQWRAVASLSQEGMELKPDPSYFKGGDDLPVENVTWKECLEFCAWLSKYTGRNYRLPSEAEWEYACRAMQNPEQVGSESSQNPPVYPRFHYGEALPSEIIARHYPSRIHREEPTGQYRRRTTLVKSFPPNAFGLYDMHGNVYEWCLDPWHDNYEGAPGDGSVWDGENNNDNRYQNALNSIDVLIKDKRSHVYRGGSWGGDSRYCRSASRSAVEVGTRLVGFRVVCVPQDS